MNDIGREFRPALVHRSVASVNGGALGGR
jgi:hypothetical protein